MRRLSVVLVALLTLAATLLGSAPAGSATYPWKAVITFDKNWKDPASSRLVWKLYRLGAGGAWTMTETRTWRAGSGMLGRAGRNACVRNTGWLPNGTYSVKQYADYPGNLIKGRAFRLDDKACGNGTVRRDLFVHTEQGAGNRQCPDRPGDQVCRWEFPRINDYKSAGCIKLAPGDLADLVRRYQQHFSPGVRYPKDRVVLRVTD